MKHKYMMLLMMISGPKQPGNEDLILLWKEVDVDDSYTRYDFKMCVMLFCIINDFPAYGNLSGYSVEGHKTCTICKDDTCFHQLQNGKKILFTLGIENF